MNYQWNIFWADLNPIKGSEQAGIRPVLVISEEAVNQALPIVTIICLTSHKQGRKVYPIEVLLEPNDSHLPNSSIVMAHQIRSISKERLNDKCGFIQSEEVKEKIRQAVKLYLDLL
ncbi:MAG: type II toxin-antitoxin system PemK/MazF family toxin [Clostridia bacterium]|uniref:type II toxin-antitoxin system PemK/MazF family toxin n=1 Tax=Desulfitibacter alkalitolerans TaxID=264641 RepID=UPI000488B9A5|nr:type II toxin-antitoxin system PemK/MazF family toxin [Desulfitibacter alkalitolerans]MBS3970515.1 type II toxin-antitoxin system PemK/MazF family toxin [Clostridia bacterium]